MISYKKYQLLENALAGGGCLGITQKQSLGFVSNMPGVAEDIGQLGGSFGKDGPDMSADKDPSEEPMGEPDMDLDDDDAEGDEGDEGEGSLEDRIAELEAEIAKLKAELGHHEEEDDEIHDDLEDDEDDLSGDEEKLGDEKSSPGAPMTGVYMKKGMKKESIHGQNECGEEGELMNKKGGPTFMMKKGMKEGACGCKKCKAKMKKESSFYDRPQDYDPSEKAFWQSLGKQIASQEVTKKFNDGMRNFHKEDVLLPPTDNLETPAFRNPQAGDVGYATQTRIGAPLGTQTESVDLILKKIEDLKNQLKKASN